MKSGCAHSNHCVACGACGEISYCSSKCADVDWKQFHRYECIAGSEDGSLHQYGFLFLAHDGVALPEVWTRYFEYLRRRGIKPVVGVMSNPLESVKYQNDFTARFRMPLDMETRWCHLSTLKAHFAAMRYMLDFKERFTYLFLVSGTDIPIASAEKLIQAANFSALPTTTHTEKYMEHTQWVQLRRQHVEKLITYSADKLEALEAKVGRQLECPDEYLTGILLTRVFRLRLITKYQADFRDPSNTILDVSRTDMERFCETYPSPIEWQSFDEKRFVTWVEGTQYERDARTPDYVRKNLNMILEEDLNGNDFIFFRKVTALDGEPSHTVRTLLPWLLPLDERNREKMLKK